MALKNMTFRKDIRRMAAEARAEARAQLSPEEQLQVVIDRGHPNCREANRLRAQIAKGGSDGSPEAEVA